MGGTSVVRRVTTLGVAAVAVAAGLVVANRPEPAHAADQPNVVVITVDDMRADEMWVLPKTRALLGDAGTTFTNSFVSTSLCCPSRAAFLTGQYSTNNKVPNNDSYARFDGTNHLGRWLDDAGYFTSLIGKYLHGYTCKKARPPGWDHWQALCSKIYSQYAYSVKDRDQTVTSFKLDSNYQTDVLANRAVATMQEARAAGAPYFLWVTPVAPHAGSVPPTRYAQAIKTFALPHGPSWNEEDVSDKPAFINALAPITTKKAKAIQNQERTRLRTLMAVDDLVETVVRDVEAAGDLDDTVIMFTSDNGYLLGEHRIVQGKEVEYEESLRVPLLVRGPGVPVGTNDAPVLNTDLAPTIVALAGAAPGRTQDGQSWLPRLGSPEPWQRRALFHQLHKDKASEADGPAHPGGFGVRAGRFTYFELSTGERELYDHRTDPYELANRIDDPRRSRVVEQLTGVLSTLRGCAGAACHVTVPNLTPVADATYGCIDLQCSFDASTANDPEGDLTYAWDFGDGTTGTGVAPLKTYAGSGTRTVTVTVTDDEGASDTFSMQVTVLAGNLSPVAEFTANCTGRACTFDGGPSHDFDGTITGYAWSFDDGGSGNGSVVDHTFGADGTYNVTLTVTDDRGGTNATTIPFTVEAPNSLPVPVLDVSCSGLSCTFTGERSTDADDPIVLYEWDFGDGLSEDGVTRPHVYGLHGTYLVVLRVTDGRGKSASTSTWVTV
jgi:arylsulfatase A-like enzyme/PKD repeat protein